MRFDLERRDYGVIAAILVGGLALMMATAMLLGPTFESLSKFYQGAVLLFGAYVAYRLFGLWGGKIGKGFIVIAAAFVALMLQYIFHIKWHLDAVAQMQAGGSPYLAWLGISGKAWLGFFHGIGAATMIVLGYGFYLLWEAGHPGE